jgi:hypothetical protein
MITLCVFLGIVLLVLLVVSCRILGKVQRGQALTVYDVGDIVLLATMTVALILILLSGCTPFRW